MCVRGVATCGAAIWIGLGGARRHKLSLPVNHVPYLSALMCIARINIYGITLTVSSLTRAHAGMRSPSGGGGGESVRIDTRLHSYQNARCVDVRWYCPSRWLAALKRKRRGGGEINEMEMKRIQRTVEYTSKSGHGGESARGASIPFVWIAAANGMQDKTAGLLSAIHHVPISRDTTDAHAGIQILNLA